MAGANGSEYATGGEQDPEAAENAPVAPAGSTVPTYGAPPAGTDGPR